MSLISINFNGQPFSVKEEVMLQLVFTEDSHLSLEPLLCLQVTHDHLVEVQVKKPSIHILSIIKA